VNTNLFAGEDVLVKNTPMKHVSSILLWLMLSAGLFAQTTTINLGLTTSLYDSTFVIQTGMVDSFHQGNHPGAGPYMNGEIYLCANSTLKYNYSPGTSSYPTFYLEDNAHLIFTQTMMSGLVYLKNGASVTGNNQVNFIYLKRVSGSTVSNFGAGSTLQDSIFTSVNYTFNGWPNNSSPCQAPTLVQQTSSPKKALRIYPNPTRDQLYVGTATDEFIDVRILTPGNQTILQSTLRGSEGINVKDWAKGLYFIQLRFPDGTMHCERFLKN